MSGGLTFPEAFARRIPLELKQMVFRLIATGGTNDIEVRLAHDNNRSLESPALELLERLKKWYPTYVYTDAISYLTGPTFRWVFISDQEPHRQLLAIFHKQFPLEFRQQIKHVYMRRVGVANLINLGDLPPHGLYYLTDRDFPETSVSYSDYIRRTLKKIPQERPANLVCAIFTDIRGGLLLLPYTLPSIDRLDIGLDIHDCLVDISYKRATGEGKANMSRMQSFFLSLKNFANLSQLSIRILWDKYFDPSPRFS